MHSTMIATAQLPSCRVFAAALKHGWHAAHELPEHILQRILALVLISCACPACAVCCMQRVCATATATAYSLQPLAELHMGLQKSLIKRVTVGGRLGFHDENKRDPNLNMGRELA